MAECLAISTGADPIRNQPGIERVTGADGVDHLNGRHLHLRASRGGRDENRIATRGHDDRSCAEVEQLVNDLLDGTTGTSVWVGHPSRVLIGDLHEIGAGRKPVNTVEERGTVVDQRGTAVHIQEEWEPAVEEGLDRSGDLRKGEGEAARHRGHWAITHLDWGHIEDRGALHVEAVGGGAIDGERRRGEGGRCFGSRRSRDVDTGVGERGGEELPEAIGGDRRGELGGHTEPTERAGGVVRGASERRGDRAVDVDDQIAEGLAEHENRPGLPRGHRTVVVAAHADMVSGRRGFERPRALRCCEPMSPLAAVWFVVGVVALVVGAESLVRGSSRLAARSGLSPVIIGLTVVAFGTSAPELAVSIGAAAGGESEIALGNVVGSNIANVLLVLGLSAVVGGGLAVAQRIVRVDVPIMIVLSALVLVLGLDGRIGRVDGTLFVGVLAIYLVWTVRSALGDPKADDDQDGVPDAAELASEYSSALGREKIRGSSWWRDLVYVLGGLGLLVVGARALVTAATDIARAFDISELVIGLTVVAVGTSLPEIATSVVAAARGQRDMAVGNAIGSNLFNILAVLGITGVLSPITVSSGARGFDLPFMLAVAIACVPIFADGFVLRRWQGGVFLGYYGAYLIWLGLDSADHDLHPTYAVAMGYFVVPLTVLTLVVVGYRAATQGRTGASTDGIVG